MSSFSNVTLISAPFLLIASIILLVLYLVKVKQNNDGIGPQQSGGNSDCQTTDDPQMDVNACKAALGNLQNQIQASSNKQASLLKEIDSCQDNQKLLQKKSYAVDSLNNVISPVSNAVPRYSCSINGCGLSDLTYNGKCVFKPTGMNGIPSGQCNVAWINPQGVYKIGAYLDSDKNYNLVMYDAA